MCSCLQRNKNPQTVKLSPRSSPKLLGRYANNLTPMRPNRPHIPSFINFSKSVATKIDKVTSFLAHPRQPYHQILLDVSVTCVSASFRYRFVSASVRRYLRMVATSRKRKNADRHIIFEKHIFYTKSGGWRHDPHKSGAFRATNEPAVGAKSPFARPDSRESPLP